MQLDVEFVFLLVCKNGARKINIGADGIAVALNDVRITARIAQLTSNETWLPSLETCGIVLPLVMLDIYPIGKKHHTKSWQGE